VREALNSIVLRERSGALFELGADSGALFELSQEQQRMGLREALNPVGLIEIWGVGCVLVRGSFAALSGETYGAERRWGAWFPPPPTQSRFVLQERDLSALHLPPALQSALLGKFAEVETTHIYDYIRAKSRV
jgi:hypothetical protein